MKMIRYKLLLAAVVVLAVCTGSTAQDSVPARPQQLKVKKHTVLAQYEDQMVLSAEERLRLKQERRELVLKRRAILDTLDISESRRRRLLRELYRSPFSTKWERLVTDLDIEDQDGF